MTIGQYLTSFAAIAAVIAVALIMAASRDRRALLVTTVVFVAGAVAFFLLRARAARGPGPVATSVIACVSIVVGAAIAYCRRNSRSPAGRLASGVLAWLGIVFAWFETAYLLR